MGTREQVSDTGRRLRDSLQLKIDDGTFDPADREDFSRIHAGLSRRLSDFATSPRYGSSSARYDTFIAKAQAATAAVNGCTPASSSSIATAKRESQAASNELPSITGSEERRGAGLFIGSLRLGSGTPNPSVGTPENLETRSSIQSGTEAEEGEEPNEPYYQSLVKLFPVEAVTLYPMAVGIAGEDRGALRILVGVIALVVVGLRFFGTKPATGGQPDWAAVGVALCSFLLYAAALGAFGVIYKDAEKTAMLLSFLTVIWVAFVPYILRKRPDPQGS
jgi:hypothetical protein